MSQLFISHSSADRDQVTEFCNFLVLGMGIPQEMVFCTALDGTLLTGDAFIARIREELQDCRQVLCFITPNYLVSRFCMAELGAAWVQQNKVFPLISPPLQHRDLDNTPLLGLQMGRLDNGGDLTVLYDQLCQRGLAPSGRTSQFNRQLERYLALERRRHRAHLLPRDSQGYYCAKIKSVRPIKPAFRCYQIDGLAALPEIAPVPGESHWLLYRAGIYEDLVVGDTVRFSISSTELRNFPDLKNARNIYPKDLSKII